MSSEKNFHSARAGGGSGLLGQTQQETSRPDAKLRAHNITALEEVQQRVLWLSTSIIHHANRVRPNKSGLKVGGD